MIFSCMTCMTIPYMYTIYADHSLPLPCLTFLTPLSVHPLYPISTALSHLFCDPVSLCSAFWVNPQPEIMTSDTWEPTRSPQFSSEEYPFKILPFLLLAIDSASLMWSQWNYWACNCTGCMRPRTQHFLASLYFQVLTCFLLSFLLCSLSLREYGVSVYLGPTLNHHLLSASWAAMALLLWWSCKKRILWLRLRVAFVNEYEHTHWEDSLMLC